MDYTCVLTLNKIKAYLAGAAVVGFDFETSSLDEYRDEDRAALDADRPEPAPIIIASAFSISLCILLIFSE